MRGAPAAALVALLALGCGPTADTGGTGSGSPPGGAESAPQLCAAIRGNGQLVLAHFPALARIVEHYGLIDAGAGGSSATISLFFYESILLNPALSDCGGRPCTPEETADRAALLLKSVEGYFELLATTDEAVAFQQLTPILKRAQEMGIDRLAAEEKAEAAGLLLTLLRSPDLRDLVNQEVIELLAQSPRPGFHAREVYTALTTFGDFRADDPAIFFRPGILDFQALAGKIGRVANFLAGYGPADGAATEHFLASCAAPSRGKSWSALSPLPAGASTCGALFTSLLGGYRARLLAHEASFPSRLDDAVGRRLRVLVSTSVLVGEEAAREAAAARARYRAGEELRFASDFSRVRFGYWGRGADLLAVGANPRHFGDLKSEKFLALDEAPWRLALATSPAEPGLSAFRDLGPGRISAGGWSDLHPVLALRSLGCAKVVYLTRRGEESRFAQGVATLLGMSPTERERLYALDRAEGAPAGSFLLSLTEADGVWCTDWNAFGATQVEALVEDAYNAPFETRDPFFTAGPHPYPGAASRLEVRGCTPGAVPGPGG